ncbi:MULTISPECIES: TolB family protein [Flavobacteriaceae]|uniref:TolB family protein n=1 Tax=Flavobacteriaceae TaxID=49546 RepID=UPI00234B58F8|nr:biopolymer transporter TolR [Muricauda sp. SP22]MDC6362615.1 biopolymer transporter TolR [Muricauda sp. SP22]
MKKVLLTTILLATLSSFISAEKRITQESLTPSSFDRYGIFQHQINIGNPLLSGTTAYDPLTQEYTIQGAGSNMWGKKDEFQYVYQSIQGDFILRTHVAFVGEGIDAHRKIGWIVRNNLQGDSPHVNACVHGDGLTSLQFRRESGAETEELISPDKAPDVVQLERRNGVYYMSTAKFGEPFTTIKLEGVSLKNEVFVGLYVCSHNVEVLEKAIFSNVRIIKPAPMGFKPYQDYIGSNMEVMNVDTGHRKVLFQSAHSIQAPNWSTDGKALLYNSNGFLYRYSFENQEISQLNTGTAISNNNDHVFSFDGSLLGISNHNPDDGGLSSIYVMNPEGDSRPKKVTKDGVGASYLHGISPDNTQMVFTGHRNGKYDLYSVNIASGQEKQLTDTKDLDDGSEYSPDGKYIYFNSNRTGSMHLWRMDADGSNPVQLTDDPNFKDWFPHISPDGKWIAFISFPPTTGFGDHPFYRHCTLRLMSTKGDMPKIIAYIYGGQGTINVTSWSPDSKQIAFVTNSD